MKKKILLILSMSALLVCLFVISASATVVTYESISDSFGDDNPTGTERTAYFGEINYGNIPNGNFVFCHGESSDSCFFVTIFDIEAFQFRYSGKSFSDFVDEIMTLYDSNSYEYQYLYKFYSAVSSEVYDFFINWSSYTGGFTQEDLTAQYNQGKTDGVNEYKESEEYTNILSSKYEDGKESGYNEGYSKGMFDFAQEEKDLIEGYYSQGGEFTANGLNEFISSYSSETFRDIYNSLGTESIYNLLEDNFSSSSSSSSHGGSSVTVTQQGENYGKSHYGDISSDCCYNPGYIDGVADGGTIYKGSDSYQADITNEINSYMQSEEYQTLMNEYSEEVVTNYLKSEEYRTAIDSSFVAGQDAGEADAWEKAKDEVLAEGVRQGYLNYKGSQEYKDAIDSSKTAGYLDGVEDGKNSVVDPSGVLILFAIAIFLGLIIFAIHKKVRSKRRR